MDYETITSLNFLKRNFYFLMSLLIAVVVIYGFSHTVDKNLIHATIPRPFILYIHVAVFFGWVIFFIIQSALVRIRKVKIHRIIGWLGAGLGLAVPILGVITAMTMAQFNINHFHSLRAEPDLIVQFFDMVSFTVPFLLAVFWRKRLDFHRRLILVASCALTSAAFGRFPHEIIPPTAFYGGVDILVFLGVTYDFIFEKRIHPVYLISLPTLVLGQITVMYISIHDLPFWVKMAHTILNNINFGH